MPYKFDTDKMLIPREYDKRVKLTDEDKEDIKRLYFKEKEGVRAIARMYENKCSRRTIQFVLFPERLKTVNFPGHYKKYYDKKKNAQYAKTHRNYKLKLYKNHELTRNKKKKDVRRSA